MLNFVYFKILCFKVQTPGSQIDSTNYLARIDVNSKKRHRRVKSNHKSDQNNPEGKLQYPNLNIVYKIIKKLYILSRARRL